MVSLQWDLGGYVITAQPAVLGGAELEIVADRLEVVLAGQKATLEALVYDIPVDLKTVGMSWNLGDGSPEVTEVLQVDARQEATHEFEHTYEQPGEYTLTARVLHPDTGDPLAVVTRPVNVRQFKVQIYPNRVTGRIGLPVESSCLPSEFYYRYEWIFGDGKTLADGKSVVQHTYDTAGTYDLTVRMYDRSFEGRFLAQDTIKVDITGQEGECPLCGHVHGPLNQVETDYQILYHDGNNKMQCVLHSYFDKAKTQLREVVIYVDGKRDGPSIECYDNGNKKFERSYQAGLTRDTPGVQLAGEIDLRARVPQ